APPGLPCSCVHCPQPSPRCAHPSRVRRGRGSDTKIARSHRVGRDGMIKVIERMPVGTIGLEARGKVTEQDYREVLVPALTLAQEQGKVRLLYVLADGFESFS